MSCFKILLFLNSLQSLYLRRFLAFLGMFSIRSIVLCPINLFLTNNYFIKNRIRLNTKAQLKYFFTNDFKVQRNSAKTLCLKNETRSY